MKLLFISPLEKHLPGTQKSPTPLAGLQALWGETVSFQILCRFDPEEAVSRALAQLGLDRDEVSVEILERAKSGFFGIGASPAKVRVTYGLEEEEPVPAPAPKPAEKRPEAHKAPKAEAKPAGKPEKPEAEKAPEAPKADKAPRKKKTPAGA